MHEINAIPWCGLREPFAVLSHWLGASLFVGLTVRLWNYGRGDRSRRIAILVLGVTTVQTLLISGVYHRFGPGPWRSFFLQADVAGIFLLIAGSATPVHIILFRGAWRSVPLILAWSVALVGATLKLTVHPGNPGTTGTLIFIVFGWGGVVTTIKLWRDYGFTFVREPILSGLCYTLGATLLVLEQPTLVPGVLGPHEVWHLAVLCALGLHWAFVFRIARQAATTGFAPVIHAAQPANADEALAAQWHTV